jgi:hypothetical protein
MFAPEGGSFGLQIGGQATDFVLLVMNEKGAESVMSSKVKIGARRIGSGGARGGNHFRGNRCGHEGPDPFLVAGAGCFRRNIARGVDAALGRRCQQEPLRQGHANA